MFCPNCGTENEEAATTCKKCGFNLKGAAAPKFKGTMLMMNAPAGMPKPGAPAAAPGGVPAPGAPPPAGVPGAGGPLPAAPRPQLKGTMLGVAPPSMGGQAPPAAPQGFGPPPGAAPAAPQGFGPPPGAAPQGFGPPPGAAPAAPQGFGPPPGAAPQGFGPPPGAAPQGFGPPPGAYGPPPGAAPAPAPHHQPVNPLGGTMVADPSVMGPGFPYGAPPAQPAPPADPGGYGVPPPGGFGGPPPGGGFGGPPPGGGFGGPPQDPGGYGGPPPGGFGGGPAPAPYGAPAPGGFTPPAQGFGMPGGGAPMVPAGQRGPVGKIRNPVMAFVLSMVCFVYAIITLWGTTNELKAFRGKDDINPIFFFIPILGIIEMWKLPAKMLEAKQMAGVPNAQVPHPILYLLLGLYFIPADLNEVWQAAGGGQPQG